MFSEAVKTRSGRLAVSQTSVPAALGGYGRPEGEKGQGAGGENRQVERVGVTPRGQRGPLIVLLV